MHIYLFIFPHMYYTYPNIIFYFTSKARNLTCRKEGKKFLYKDPISITFPLLKLSFYLNQPIFFCILHPGVFGVWSEFLGGT